MLSWLSCLLHTVHSVPRFPLLTHSCGREFPAILKLNQFNCIISMKKELPVSKKTGVFPIGAMSTVALASFMDSFCYQIIVPNLPFAVKRWFPSVDFILRFLTDRLTIRPSVTTTDTLFQCTPLEACSERSSGAGLRILSVVKHRSSPV